MIKYARILNQMREAFSELIIQHISRAENEKADRLANMAGTLARSVGSGVLGKELISQVELPEENANIIKMGDLRYDIYK